jgi:AcrR family transcriptional regulator
MARRLDRRVQRTRKLLRDAMMALILEEGYDALSIQDITDKANLGRATFYLHFKDKDELLMDVMDQFMEDILVQVPQLAEIQWRLEDTKNIAKLFDFAAEHYDLYRILTISSGAITASRQLHQTIASNIKTCIQREIDELGDQPIIPVEFIANHFAGSLLSIMYWWLDSDLPYSAEEMAEMFQKVNQLDRKSLMGFKEEAGEGQDNEGKPKEKKRAKEKNGQKKGKPETKPDEEKNIDIDNESDQIALTPAHETITGEIEIDVEENKE